jgi:DinB superfamily
MNKLEIITALKTNVDLFNQHIASLNKEKFESAPEGKWSAGQNLEHLYRSIKPLNLAYALPGFILKLMFGKTNRPSKTFDELVTKYKNKLAAGGRASGRFIPPPVLFADKEALLKKYTHQKEKLIQKINGWSEEKLDQYILPHPLLGKLTLREMLYFTIYHNTHHIEILQRQ